MGKYDPLSDFLQSLAGHLTEVTLTFKQIEQLIGDRLPQSAHRYREWWSNPGDPNNKHIQARAWLAAGWRVATVNQDEQWVRFEHI